MSRFNRAVTDHPWLTIALFLGVTLVLAVRIPRLQLDTDVVSLMPAQHPERVYFEWTRDYFDAKPAVVLIVVNEGPDGVFTPGTLALIRHLSDSLAATRGIEDDDDVVSLSTVKNIRGEADALLVERFFAEPPTTLEAGRAVRAAVFDNPMMVGRVVTADGHAAAVGVKLRDEVDLNALYDDLLATVDAAPITTERVIIAGRPILDVEWGRLAREDLRRMLPLVVVVAAVLLGVLLRSGRGAVLPLLVVLTAVVWTLGLMAWIGATFYVITILLPTLLIAVGVADGIHVIHQFMLGVGARPDQPRREIVFATMEELTRPVVMTSITTAAGFSSLALSPITAVRSLGLFTAFGVLAAMVFSLTILPALLCVLPAPLAAARHATGTQAGRGLGTRPLAALTPFVVQRPLLAVSVGAAVLIAGLSGLPRLVVDGSLIRNFPTKNPVRLADAELIRYFGGSYPMQIVFEAEEDDAWNDPVKLRAVAGLQQRIETAKYTGKTRSLADYVKRMHQALHPEVPDAYVLPDSQALVTQYLFLYSLSGAPDDFEDVVDYGYREACVHALVRADHSPLLKQVIADIDSYAAEHIAPLGISTRVTGNAKIAYVFIELITTGQVRSLLVALVLVVLLTGLLCRALAAGLFAVTPVAVAVALNFGALGWFGIPLGPTTAMISSIGIGIGVDYAIHFLVKYQRVRRAGLAPEAAMRETLGTAGVAIFYNALVVFAGFLALIGSQFPPNRVLGLLVAMNMVVCFLGTVTLMAALLHRLQPAFVHPLQGTRGLNEGGTVK